MRALSAATVVVVAGCGARPLASPADDARAGDEGGSDLVVFSRGDATSLRVEGHRAWGPSVEVQRMAAGYRGVWRGQVVDLRIDDAAERVRGTVGSMPFDLHVSTSGGKNPESNKRAPASNSTRGNNSGCARGLVPTV